MTIEKVVLFILYNIYLKTGSVRFFQIGSWLIIGFEFGFQIFGFDFIRFGFYRFLTVSVSDLFVFFSPLDRIMVNHVRVCLSGLKDYFQQKISYLYIIFSDKIYKTHLTFLIYKNN